MRVTRRERYVMAIGMLLIIEYLQLREKVDEQRENRTLVKKAQLPKVNKELASKLQSDLSLTQGGKVVAKKVSDANICFRHHDYDCSNDLPLLCSMITVSAISSPIPISRWKIEAIGRVDELWRRPQVSKNLR